MQKYAVVEKKVGQTPLQALEVFRVGDKNLAGVPLTYAGRLDPMASGKLLILIGDECKKRKQYDGLDKEYEFEVLFGVKSDTGDVLGLSEVCGGVPDFSEGKIRDVAKSFIGKQSLPYPAYSSKTVQGIPLFHHAIGGGLAEIEIPTARVEIYKMEFCGMRKISGAELLRSIVEKINTLQIDTLDGRPGSGFRKEEIIAHWRETLADGSKTYIIAEFRATVSSGTYIRSLSPLLAEKLGTFGLAHSITRTQIGRFVFLAKRFGFWGSKF